MSITSGLSPVRGYANGGMSEEEQFKDAMKEQGIAKLEEALGIRLPRGSEESEEALINNILGNVTDLPIQKRGDEYTYGDDDGFSFYVNPEEEGAGVRYNKRFADGGIAAYANGGDVNTERQNMLAKLGFPSGITNEQLDAAIAKQKSAAYLPESQASGGTKIGDLPGLFKENIFDITDPVDIFTLPFLSAKAAKLAGKAGKKVYDTVRGSGGKLRENLRGIGAYVGTDMIADEIRGDDAFFNKTEEEGLEDDALDQAKDDLNVVNAEEEKKDQSDPFFTQKEDGSFESTAPEPGKEKELTKKEKGIKALGRFFESFGDSQSEYSSTPGYMIEGMGASTPEITRYQEGGSATIDPKVVDSVKDEEEEIMKGIGRFFESLGDSGKEYSSTKGYTIKGMDAATPEITRYQEGGIANMDPMMMAGGGIAKFAVGKAVVKKGKEGIERLKDEYKKRKKKIKEKRKAPKKSTKKSKSTDLVPYDEARAADAAAKRSRGFFDFLPVPMVAASSTAGRVAGKVGEVAKDYGRPLAGAGGLGLGAAGIYGLSQLGDKEQTAEEKAEAQALLDKAAAEKAYKERQEAREGLTSMPDIIRARSLERAQAAGRSEPTFVDYVASFPASYSEKIGKDPEFAKQMMAGFAAMGKTTEGYVTRNAFTDFTQGVQEERVRQDEGMSDQLKLLKETQNNPDIAQQLRNLNRPEITSTELSMLMSQVKQMVGDSVGVVLKDTDVLVDANDNIVNELDLAEIQNAEGPAAVLEYARTLTYRER